MNSPEKAANGMTKLIWFMMYKEGGFWTAEEIQERMDFQPGIASRLTQLADAGFLHRMEKSKAHKRVRWGVTGACRIPNGITLAEIVAVGLGGRVPGANDRS